MDGGRGRERERERVSVCVCAKFNSTIYTSNQDLTFPTVTLKQTFLCDVKPFPHSHTQADIPLRRQAELSTLEPMPFGIVAFIKTS